MRNERAKRVWPFGAPSVFMLVIGVAGLFVSLLLWPVAAQGIFAPQNGEAASGNAAEAGLWPNITLTEVISQGVNRPVQLTHAGDGSGRLFIVEKPGSIRIYKDGTLLNDPFLDISDLVSGSNEQGLLGLAFSPDYVNDGDFYVNYTDTNGDTQIVRYHVSADSDVALSDSAEIVLSVEQDFANHNGGQILFGPDGYLYIGMGDGGSANDPRNRAQDPTQLLGKMLRIDVESGDPLTYTIPANNPFVDDANTRDEIWALGLRNPWRFSFDKQTGDLYIADVGQYSWEEIDFQPADSSGGQNYGWRCYEGTHQNIACQVENHTPPILEYSHSQDPDTFHCSVTGGMVYRGQAYTSMQGIYFYSDYCSNYIWGLRYTGSQWENHFFTETSGSPSSFGEDEAGNLYLLTFGPNAVYQIVTEDTPINTHTPTPTDTPTPTHTNTPTPTDTPIPTNTATPTPTNTPTSTHTNTPTPTDTPILGDAETPTPTDTPIPGDAETPTPTDTPIPGDADTPTPTHTPTPTATATVVQTEWQFYLPLLIR